MLSMSSPFYQLISLPSSHDHSWYDEEQQRQETVESSSGPCMNQHVAPSGVTHLSPEHKQRLSNELRDILEGWHGGPLELTSIYGIRCLSALPARRKFSLFARFLLCAAVVLVLRLCILPLWRVAVGVISSSLFSS
jgi:hypothetical protein